MTGCDKIVEEILEEARQAVRTKLDTAEQKAAAVAAEGRRNAQEQAATILSEGLEQEEGIRRAARSAAALRVRNAKLAHRRRELDAAMTYGATGLPMTVFIDADGNLVTYARGMLQAQQLEQGIEMIKP